MDDPMVKKAREKLTPSEQRDLFEEDDFSMWMSLTEAI